MIHFQNTPFKDFVDRIFKKNVLSRPSLFFSPLSSKLTAVLLPDGIIVFFDISETFSD